MPMDRRRYHPDFDCVSQELRAVNGRSGGRCECRGECGDVHVGHRCYAPNGGLIVRDPASPATWRPATKRSANDGAPIVHQSFTRVVLTVAHLQGHAPEDPPDRERLRAMCQRCHLQLDRGLHAVNAAATRRRRAMAAGALDLPLGRPA